jgi:Polyketide cyclase / dehydrase and lipid transport
MRDVELLTPLPIGPGTRFLARLGRAGTEMVVEIVEFDRPNRLASRTTSSMMTTPGTLTFAPDGDGTLMAWDWQVQPKEWLRALGPLFGLIGARMERGIWTGLKSRLEGGAEHPSA